MNQVRKRKANARHTSSRGYIRILKIPRAPAEGNAYWIDSPNGHAEFTHRLIHFPAKFHPPIVRWALGNYARKGSVVLDPFTGSGTVQVEALTRGVSSVGIDIDPLACLVAQAKTTPIAPTRLALAIKKIEGILSPYVEARETQVLGPGKDISQAQYGRESTRLTVPPIPNLNHWFRRHVAVDLARVLWAIDEAELPAVETRFFRACLAAIVRRVSNADPDPVSGLEVTRIQSEKNLTRNISVFHSFFDKSKRATAGMHELWSAYAENGAGAKARIIRGDTLRMEQLLSTAQEAEAGYPLVITSPPYCRAVEYSRRHQLEFYWLGLIQDQTEQVALTHKYIGRKLVRWGDWAATPNIGIPGLERKIRLIAARDAAKAHTVAHYFHSMSQVFAELAKVLRRHGTLVLVIGNSTCCGIAIPTADYISELAADQFVPQTRFAYAIQNHAMQYGLWNGDGIKQEHVLVLKAR